MKALILVGLQRDFLAGGSLAVPGGADLVAMANELQKAFRLTVATQQWHPANHRAFALNHRGRVVGERIRIARIEQVLKPIHCVQKTPGAELSAALSMARINKVIRLGTDAEFDDFSGFFDGGDRRSTGLSDYLHEKKVHSIYIMGLALEHEVQATALDAVGLGFKVWIVEDACRPANPNPDGVREAFAVMQDAGVKFVRSTNLGRARTPKANRTIGA